MYIISVPMIVVVLPIIAILGMGAGAANFVAENAMIIGIILVILKLAAIIAWFKIASGEADKPTVGNWVIAIFSDVVTSIIFMLALLRFANGVLDGETFFSIIGNFIAIIVNAAAMVIAEICIAFNWGLLGIVISVVGYLLCVFA